MHPLLLCHVWALHGVQQCRGIPVERDMLFRDKIAKKEKRQALWRQTQNPAHGSLHLPWGQIVVPQSKMFLTTQKCWVMTQHSGWTLLPRTTVFNSVSKTVSRTWQRMPFTRPFQIRGSLNSHHIAILGSFSPKPQVLITECGESFTSILLMVFAKFYSHVMLHLTSKCG